MGADATSVDFDSLSLSVDIQNQGYIYIYVSNESPGAEVWWDDLTIIHQGVINTQSTDYYPFGAVMSRAQTYENQHYKYGYQRQFAEEDEETGWNSFELRMYDAVIGRWFSAGPRQAIL